VGGVVAVRVGIVVEINQGLTQGRRPVI